MAERLELPLFRFGSVTLATGLDGVFLDFNDGARIRVPAGDYRVRITDQDAMCVLFDGTVSDCTVVSTAKYYVNFLVELWKDGRKVLRHALDLAGRKVCAIFPSGTLGDSLAWLPYAEQFRKRHGCRMFCIMQEEIGALFQPNYPEITFLPPDTKVPDCYAAYYMGIFPPEDGGVHQPENFQLMGLGHAAACILGLPQEELRPTLTPCAERPVREPYVCIATQSTAQRKYWNNPRGWRVTVEHLRRRGYRVLCIDRDRGNAHGPYENAMPPGAEDFTGSLPLQQRVDLLGHADFFIGLSSGLSWLAWGAGAPVVLISGFTLPRTEFYTPYRVIQYHVCNGCWNDSRVPYLSPDFLYCPKHGGTDRAFECTRYITPEQVCKTVDRLMEDRGLDPLRNAARD